MRMFCCFCSASLVLATADLLLTRRQYATASCSGRVTGHYFTSNPECVPPNNWMGDHWVRASCSELGGNVTFEHFDSPDCSGEALVTEVRPSGCSLCADPGYTCHGGGLRSIYISCSGNANSGSISNRGFDTWWSSLLLLMSLSFSSGGRPAASVW
mmetsp:Transcript_34028/g.63528  ORF Transcript_34028/g.63528 Transcript_34028/m.63528 type:complete len:156 (-) Transcript_34028:86-553(-)